MTQERAVRTREHVLDAAAEEFAAHGYMGTTLLDVIQRTGMTKGALYGHFSSKEELAAALIEEAGGELSTRAARTGEPDAAAVRTLRETVLDLARHLRQDTRARSALRLAVESPHLDRHDLGLVQRICLQLTRAVEEAQSGDGSTGGYPRRPWPACWCRSSSGFLTPCRRTTPTPRGGSTTCGRPCPGRRRTEGRRRPARALKRRPAPGRPLGSGGQERARARGHTTICTTGQAPSRA